MPQQNIFSRQPPTYRALIIACIASIIILFLDWRIPNLTQPARDVLRAAYNPIYAAAHFPVISLNWLELKTESPDQLARENRALKAKLLQAQVRLQKLAELSAENARLRGLLDTPLILDGRIRLAEVIGTDADPLRHILIINRGENDSVYEGQIVLDHDGVIGQVIDVYPHSSRILLLSDKEHSLSVRIERTGMRAVVSGIGDLEKLEMKYVATNANIEVGDKVYSSGLGPNFPAGYFIGTVARIQRHNTDEFAEITVTPASKLSAIQHVALLFSNSLAKEQPHANP